MVSWVRVCHRFVSVLLLSWHFPAARDLCNQCCLVALCDLPHLSLIPLTLFIPSCVYLSLSVDHYSCHADALCFCVLFHVLCFCVLPACDIVFRTQRQGVCSKTIIKCSLHHKCCKISFCSVCFHTPCEWVKLCHIYFY